MIKVLINKTPIARKEHRCEFCGEMIHVGEKYNRQTNVYDNHYDDKIDDIAKDWQLPRYELVKKVLDELKKEE